MPLSSSVLCVFNTHVHCTRATRGNKQRRSCSSSLHIPYRFHMYNYTYIYGCMADAVLVYVCTMYGCIYTRNIQTQSRLLVRSGIRAFLASVYAMMNGAIFNALYYSICLTTTRGNIRASMCIRMHGMEYQPKQQTLLNMARRFSLPLWHTIVHILFADFILVCVYCMDVNTCACMRLEQEKYATEYCMNGRDD